MRSTRRERHRLTGPQASSPTSPTWQPTNGCFPLSRVEVVAFMIVNVFGTGVTRRLDERSRAEAQLWLGSRLSREPHAIDVLKEWWWCSYECRDRVWSGWHDKNRDG